MTFKAGHPPYNGPMSDAQKKSLSESRKGAGNPMWKGGPATSVCKTCTKEFQTYKNKNEHRFCSRICSNNDPTIKERKRKRAIGNAWHWKGDDVGYFGLHAWMTKKYGKPQNCDICGTKEKRMYHWANKSGKYRRIRSDWFRLCVPCHKKYDKK